MQLELTEQERQELTSLIQAAHADLGVEIHHARNKEYCQILRQRRVLLENLLKRLGAEIATTA